MKLKKHKRWNASRKAEVAVALLKGESLEEVSRVTGHPREPSGSIRTTLTGRKRCSWKMWHKKRDNYVDNYRDRGVETSLKKSLRKLIQPLPKHMKK